MARKSSVNLVGPLIVVLLIVGGCQKLIESVFGGGDEKPVSDAQTVAASPIPLPSLLKKTLVEAEYQVEALGFESTTNGIGDYSYCSDRSDCFVYRTMPKAGTVVQPGGEVMLWFVTRAEWAFYKKHRTMPNVVGWSEERADALFEPVRDVVDSSRRKSTSVPVGQERVIRQSPKPGARLRLGQKIKLVIGYNYGSTSSSGGSGDVDVNIDRHRRESRFCSRRWWC
ncbi:PASTA domain-containing protein [Sphaerisporangium viridialbum]|uniref:PASTA domain-containing protein n=1 Tax=Sphaerisporangium viridialbum TaxID=46189 RepID=UPI003C749436